MKPVIKLFTISVALLVASPLQAYGTRSITDKDNLMLLAEGLASGFIASTSAVKFGAYAPGIVSGPRDHLFYRLAAVLGWGYATTKLAPHSHECLNLEKPKKDDQVERSDKKVTALLKGGLAGYVGALGFIKGAMDLKDLFENYSLKTTTGKVIDFGSALALWYTAYKLLPYSYHKLKEAVA